MTKEKRSESGHCRDHVKLPFSAGKYVSECFISGAKTAQKLTLQLLQEQALHSPLQQLQEQGDILIGLWVSCEMRFLVEKLVADLLGRLILVLSG